MQTYILSQPLPLAKGLNPGGKRETMEKELKKAKQINLVEDKEEAKYEDHADNTGD